MGCIQLEKYGEFGCGSLRDCENCPVYSQLDVCKSNAGYYIGIQYDCRATGYMNKALAVTIHAALKDKALYADQCEPSSEKNALIAIERYMQWKRKTSDDFINPTQIGIVCSSWNYDSASLWASPRCKELKKLGILECNKKGWYRVL